jgi:hypothetical protein
MKNTDQLLLLLATALGTNSAVAGNSDVEIRYVAKSNDQMVNKGSGDGGVNETKERWVYDVTVENKTFIDLANLEVKYVIFFTQKQLGVKAAPTKR